MPTNITAKQFELTDAIKHYIEEKTASFAHHFEKIIELDVEIDKNTHHNKGAIFHVRMNLDVPQQLLRVEETQEDLYAAIDLCRDQMDRQIQKYKEKFKSKKQREWKNRRSFKSMLTFWKKS
ncbi:MAG: ribosomal subunit interface protein [Candidatus Kerfeldbacteria bacterium RIFOXYA2_FULL_38_24]|uniref:Ribosomal subunit interface protein n=1 Tax=Candidatus Kerfeldbacteria bacterium RIFOXYB2_FULL_38_14 TaxID=1798547 RepID=A0A1G2BGS2_9BACT|nr:MAG: ribosomal subunit interface protein [Candidatus Kerfeldbacteria bacterium RIFOXYA2_FULL_38_24]OGY88381.1 MAG: ribosomal subunit interface protein [Candidatus Kerfeldbacteria bacterium RIFOXYB2_FULL_38_14]OGY88519.1 MAG: ribosomal subunit interface protein [Candidatus Kerfeldbacteria bacterium RIFOXYC2_FULL_38_9]